MDAFGLCNSFGTGDLFLKTCEGKSESSVGLQTTRALSSASLLELHHVMLCNCLLAFANALVKWHRRLHLCLTTADYAWQTMAGRGPFGRLLNLWQPHWADLCIYFSWDPKSSRNFDNRPYAQDEDSMKSRGFGYVTYVQPGGSGLLCGCSDNFFSERLSAVILSVSDPKP